MRGRGTRQDQNSGCLPQARGTASGSPASQRKDLLSRLTWQIEVSYTRWGDGRLKGHRGGQLGNKAAGGAPGRERRVPREVEAMSSSLVLKSSLPARGQDSRIPAGVQQQSGTPADQEQTVCSGCLTDHPRCCSTDRARESSFSPLDQAVHLSPPPRNAAEVEEKQLLLSTAAMEQFKVNQLVLYPRQ